MQYSIVCYWYAVGYIPDSCQNGRGEEHRADKVPVCRVVLLHHIDPGIHGVCEYGLVVCEQAGEGLDTNNLGINPIMLLWWICVGISLSLAFYWLDPSQCWQSRKIQDFLSCLALHESINMKIHWPPWNWNYPYFHSELPLGRLPSRLLIMLDVFLKCFFHWDSLFLEISIKKIFILYNTRTELLKDKPLHRLLCIQWGPHTVRRGKEPGEKWNVLISREHFEKGGWNIWPKYLKEEMEIKHVFSKIYFVKNICL